MHERECASRNGAVHQQPLMMHPAELQSEGDHPCGMHPSLEERAGDGGGGARSHDEGDDALHTAITVITPNTHRGLHQLLIVLAGTHSHLAPALALGQRQGTAGSGLQGEGHGVSAERRVVKRVGRERERRAADLVLNKKWRWRRDRR